MVVGETKVCGERANRISGRINLDRAIFANSIGLSGGLWILWDSDQVEILEVASIEQEIHVIVNSSSRPPWLLSAIYASPGFAKRWLLWENLESVANLYSMPWVIVGDFNEVLMGEDKFRAIQHLEKTHSDHCPIKLCFEKIGGVQLPRPFRFQPMWLSHLTFPEVVRDAWTNSASLHQAVSNFSSKEISWNKSQFGNLFQRKNRILARLKGIQNCLSLRLNSFLIELEGKLRLEYAEVAKLEEEFWAMKVRILWLVEGDRNTFFYHTSTLVHCKRNRILCMKDRMGNWLNGEREIAGFIRQGFLDLFTSGHTSAPLAAWDPPAWNNHLNDEALGILESPVTNKEISEGLWALKPFKAPGPDGLHAGFFHHFCLVVVNLRKEVKNIFNSGVVPDYLY
ncbi:uncharacterized protein LOC126705028 [Quercus robur]|uniref:uncharacterized protein LOC126705028 n=1 Tax=Quercus robur TaxID=38942 RepID=UPI0021618257|nr:uncharacterized protein LOC126705028 [Quercus robur]